MTTVEDEDELQERLDSTPQAAGRTKCPRCAGPTSPDCEETQKYWEIGEEGSCWECGAPQVGGEEHVVCLRCDGTGWIEPTRDTYTTAENSESYELDADFNEYPPDHPAWDKLLEAIRKLDS